ncbi:hypothetical protein [Xanthomonas arboricola]|uniref:Uncharacterized protein n=4 Tax=Xanthomonas arboricola pv. pruni TaxID=69929 RepID=A0AAP4KDJ1_9XANT|nr:hypothetical protein [Xanthomonas arboricola]GAE48688.1 iron-regulated protein frpA [Xanthomonas arboricola pv. pruni str. MAFF 311562]GAE57067.1 hypothetical protein XPR_3702 [Xanthomonas arboricola pv. pruni MAFF 301420]GAE58673.1 hypothetical protein XPN_0579 [Xanthomonas arboricola pv. pruni MAFF 301427]MDN0272589.1 hypothetical protein [Xanthomonas arboricola pv. pruni]MDN0276692.1 hypothetical protein [Xanthomonas arboricola pv. pruni]
MSGPVYYVEIRYDIGGSNNIPHTFFVITKPDGSSREYGFAPLEGGALAGDGAVYETGVGTAEGEHEYQAASSKYSINQAQYESLMGFVDSTRVGSTYWAGGDHFSASMYNCTTWQSTAFNAAGIDLPTEADHAWNPYQQYTYDRIEDFHDAASDWINDKVNEVGDWSEKTAEQVSDWVKDQADRAQRTGEEWYDTAKKNLADAKKAAEDWYEDAQKWISDKAAEIGDMVDDLFDRARKWIPRRDPLTLDLDGDGIETVAASGKVLFDHDGDGIKTGTGWIASDDGLVVLDRNGNGTIDGGSELFGVDTILSNGATASSGFSALADLDTDKNGIFDVGDAEFSNVRVWRDLNQDGSSQASELATLLDAGVASIKLNPSTTDDLDLGNGNIVDNRGSYIRTDGTAGLAGDLQLAINNYFRDFSGSLDKVEVSSEANLLPGVKGSGAVRDLKEAATLSTQLLASIQALVPGTSRDAMKSSLDTITGALGSDLHNAEQ